VHHAANDDAAWRRPVGVLYMWRKVGKPDPT